MKKLIVLTIALVLILCLAGCTSPKIDPSADPTEVPAEEPTEAPTEAPTEVPTEEPTPEPTEEPTPEPTEAPTPEPTALPTEVPVELTPLEEGDYYAEIRPDQPFIVDLDGDGQDDIGLISTRMEDDYYTAYEVIITTAARPDEPYRFDAGLGWGFYGAVLDFDPSNPQKEIVFNYDQEDGDYSTYGIRWKDDGSGFEMFTDFIEIVGEMSFFDGTPEGFVFRAEEGLPMYRRTEILGTHFVKNYMTLDSEGFRLMSDTFTYEYEVKLKLKKTLELTDEKGKTFKVKKGEYIFAHSTDRETWVAVTTADGRYGSAEITFEDPEDRFPILINGIEQDEYANMPYAD